MKAALEGIHLNRREPAANSRKVLELDGSQYDSTWTLAVMHGPEDDGFRRAFFATSYVRGNEWDQPGSPVLIEREILADLLDAPAYQELTKDVRQRVRDGTVAGYVMIAMFLMWKYPELHGSRSLGGVSLNKAYQFCRHLGHDLQWRYGDGSALPGGETKIKECWRRYRSVSHLWAAHAWNNGFPIGGKHLIHEDLPAFLGAARYFQSFGNEPVVDNKSSKNTETVLGTDFWRVPETFQPVLPLPDNPEILMGSPLAQALRSYAAK
jgi:hypothetical protein